MSANGSGDLRAARIDLAAAFRWAARYELNEAVDNHFSFAPPGRDGAFLINPYGRHWSEIGPDDLLLVDGQGTVLEGEGFVEPSAYSIHEGIHRRQPHARAAMHTHMPYAAALTLLEDGRLETAAHQTALRFHGAVAYDPVFAGPARSAGGRRADRQRAGYGAGPVPGPSRRDRGRRDHCGLLSRPLSARTRVSTTGAGDVDGATARHGQRERGASHGGGLGEECRVLCRRTFRRAQADACARGPGVCGIVCAGRGLASLTAVELAAHACVGAPVFFLGPAAARANPGPAVDPRI